MDMGVFVFLIFAFLLILNVPIAMALAIPSTLCIFRYGLLLELVPIQIYAGLGKFLLLAVPFFIFAGNLMERVGISEKLIRLCKVLVGPRRYGMISVMVLTSCFFAAISGSGPATVAALGSFLIPAMSKDGYGKAMPAALMATSGAIGTVIPPSIPFVVFGLVSGASIGKLFMAGIIPGILMGVGLIIAATIVNRNNRDIVVGEKVPPKEARKILKEAIWGLLMPVIILGGIYGGIFTPTEAAGVACVYGLFVGVFIYRTIGIKEIYNALKESAIASGNIMMIISCASLFAWFCMTSGITKAATNILATVATNEILFLLITNVLLLIAGCVVESSSAIYILAPIILPVARSLGYDVIALGVVFILNLAIGNVTPPVGLNLFVACSIGNLSVKQISKAVWPYVLVSILVLLLITYFPQISLSLPNALSAR